MTEVDGPLVVLHDHLDGGVRPATVFALAEAAGVAPPVDGVDALTRWLAIRPEMPFPEAWARFGLVVSCLQTASALRRVAAEAVEDLAADGVVHAEVRFAPLIHSEGGLAPDEVMAAVFAGFHDAADTGLAPGLIVCGLREHGPVSTLAAAELAARHAGPVVGFDLAGAEVGHTPRDHATAYEVAAAAGLGRTIHAGEMDGVHQVAEALDTCDPQRIGHGWRLIDDCVVDGDRIVELGATAARVRDGRIPLEVCLTSNECLGTPVAAHPVRLLHDAGFRVTLHPDDRSITPTSPRREHRLAAELHRFDRVELAAANERAAVAAFADDERRRSLVARVREGWDARPNQLVHLAERSRWEEARSRGGTYLPSEWEADGFVHLSARHQLLTPANRFYRGRTDLVALELDARLLGDALVWEEGAATLEYFPHLYSALDPEVVVAEHPIAPAPDGGFLLPVGL